MAQALVGLMKHFLGTFKTKMFDGLATAWTSYKNI